MSLISRVINSFRKLFKLKKSSSRNKIKSKSKKVKSRVNVSTKKLVRKSSSKSSLKKKFEKVSSVKQKAVKITKLQQKQDSKNNSVSKKPAEKSLEAPKGKLVGEITHYFSRIQVVVLEVKNGLLKTGDQISIRGPKSNFNQVVKSMQIESVEVKIAKKGQIIGLKVEKDAQVGDQVFLLS